MGTQCGTAKNNKCGTDGDPAINIVWAKILL
jgi:hypothetical protein